MDLADLQVICTLKSPAWPQKGSNTCSIVSIEIYLHVVASVSRGIKFYTNSISAGDLLKSGYQQT